VTERNFYFNEHDAFAANWLRNLFPQARVDDRDIQRVTAADLAGFRRCHLFGGIGGWELALQLAEWGDAEVWTGSCPCQPFSTAGKRKGTADERHVWPEFLRLIAECQPATVFGEQVASRAGREWLAGIRADLEALGYAVGAADLCAASVGAPHIRQRLWWVADSSESRWGSSVVDIRSRESDIAGSGQAIGLAHAEHDGRGCHESWWESEGRTPDRRDSEGLEHTTSNGWQERRTQPNWWGTATRCGSDGITRRVEPGIEPLVNGVSRRMDKLRGYGNAICPQVAAVFISAFMEAA
jgi:DNA (cytosine-5)-methyltransferase 1